MNPERACVSRPPGAKKRRDSLRDSRERAHESREQAAGQGRHRLACVGQRILGSGQSSREAPSFASCAARGAHSGDGRGRTVAWGIAEARFARTPTNRRCKAGTRGDSVTRAGAVPSSPGQLSILKLGLVIYLWEIGRDRDRCDL